MDEIRPIKKKKIRTVIKVLIVAAAILLLVGSFFLRDLLIRGGMAEYDKKDILNFQQKYIAMLTNIKDEALKQLDGGKEFEIKAQRKGLFEKSEIISLTVIPEDLKEQVESVCHSYCYEITAKEINGEKLVIFSCSQKEIKCIVYSQSKTLSTTIAENTEELGDGWFYAGAGDNLLKNVLGI